MNKRLAQLLERFGADSTGREVDEELQFHIDMQASDYQAEGLTPEESMRKAGRRFGDYTQVKNQCVEIASRNTAGTKILRIIFTLAFIMGVLIRSASPELPVNRVGTVLIMIGVLGGLLLLGRKLSSVHFPSSAEPLKLGIIDDSERRPRAFDEKGRTPFERVGDAD